MKTKLNINLINEELLLSDGIKKQITKFGSVNENLKVGIINRFQDFDGAIYEVEKLENDNKNSNFKIERSFETSVSLADRIKVKVKSKEVLTEKELKILKGVLLLISDLNKEDVCIYPEFSSGEYLIKFDDSMIIYNPESKLFKDSIFPKRLILTKKDPK